MKKIIKLYELKKIFKALKNMRNFILITLSHKYKNKEEINV